MIVLIKHLAGDNLSFDISFAWRAFFFDDLADGLLSVAISPPLVTPSANSQKCTQLLFRAATVKVIIIVQTSNLIVSFTINMIAATASDGGMHVTPAPGSAKPGKSRKSMHLLELQYSVIWVDTFESEKSLKFNIYCDHIY